MTADKTSSEGAMVAILGRFKRAPSWVEPRAGEGLMPGHRVNRKECKPRFDLEALVRDVKSRGRWLIRLGQDYLQSLERQRMYPLQRAHQRGKPTPYLRRSTGRLRCRIPMSASTQWTLPNCYALYRGRQYCI